MFDQVALIISGSIVCLLVLFLWLRRLPDDREIRDIWDRFRPASKDEVFREEMLQGLPDPARRFKIFCEVRGEYQTRPGGSCSMPFVPAHPLPVQLNWK